MFLVLEGIDGSGKSDVAQKLADKLGGIVYATPPEKYRKLRKSIDSQGDLQRHYDFYREAITLASEEIRALISSGNTVICDRYWFSTIAYHRAGGMVLSVSDFSALLQPDLTALLLVSPEMQVRRSNGRKDEAGDIKGMQEVLTNLFWQVLLESKLPFVAIHTDYLNLDQVSDPLVAAITAYTNSLVY